MRQLNRSRMPLVVAGAAGSPCNLPGFDCRSRPIVGSRGSVCSFRQGGAVRAVLDLRPKPPQHSQIPDPRASPSLVRVIVRVVSTGLSTVVSTGLSTDAPTVVPTAVPTFVRMFACGRCIVVLQGRLHIVCGSEGFESDRGPWTVLGERGGIRTRAGIRVLVAGSE